MRLINLASFETLQKNVPTSGTPVRLSGYYVASTIAFNNNGDDADTITDSAVSFLSMGFQAGDKLTVAGSTSNDGTYEIATVVAGTITIIKNSVLTTEVAGDSVTLDTLHGVKVDDGVTCIIKAKADNTGIITLAPTSARAVNTLTDYFSNTRLSNGQSVSLQVKNLKEVWMDATVSTEGVEIVFEK